MFSTKQYILPSGESIDLMGYENRAFDILLGIAKNEKYLGKIYTEDQFNFDIPVIPYQDDKLRMYFPDIFVEGTIIEIKSTWTFNLAVDRNHCKFLETAKHYPFQCWIFDKHSLVEIITYNKDGSSVFSNGKEYNGEKFEIGSNELVESDIIEEVVKDFIEEIV